MLTEAKYGAAPVDLGLVDMTAVEMMSWLYCPIKLANSVDEEIPDNLKQFAPIIDRVAEDVGGDRWHESYVYVTAKTLWVNPENPGNRPGWHCDGFLTTDLNYIWADANPTIFWVGPKVRFTADHSASLAEMEAVAENDVAQWRTYPLKHLLRLDETVLHKVAPNVSAGMRTFVKVSVSEHKYCLKGNSINHRLAPDWTYAARSVERNDPAKAS